MKEILWIIALLSLLTFAGSLAKSGNGKVTQNSISCTGDGNCPPGERCVDGLCVPK